MYHMIGLGGIGMSALARILIQRGEDVQGSDIRASALLEELRNEGVKVHIGHSESSLGSATTVIFSSDIKEDNPELLSARERQLPLLHRSDCLDLLMQGKRPLLVTGTHGKTTTTALLASALTEAGLDPSFVIGGIHRGFQTNGKAGAGQYFIAEADESDGSFLKSAYYGAIVTNLEDEHLNYWKSSQFLDAAFAQFFRQGSGGERIFWCGDDPRLAALQPVGISYGFGERNKWRITAFEQTERGIRFDLPGHKNIELSLLGRHNALNGAAVFGLSLSLGIAPEAIRRAFADFPGSARRLEWKGRAHAVDFYDDYGHHPTEIRATLEALRGKIGERRLVVLFQPHRFSRVLDLIDAFPNSFDEADVVIMTDIYAAGEKPIELPLFDKMAAKLGAKLHYLSRKAVESYAAELICPHDVVLTLGAGDITHAGIPILNAYADKAPKFTVALLYGGTSAEHEVSVMSAHRIADSLDPKLYTVKHFKITKQGEWETRPMQELETCDVAIPAFHGPQGEDGMFQGLLDALNIPYVGCDYRSSALCMHKGWTKQIALCHGIPTAPFVEVTVQAFRKNPAALLDRIEAYPVWIKAVHLGSSIGVSRAANAEEAVAAAELAFAYDDVLIAEREIRGIQVEYALLGNEQIKVAKSCEILNNGFHDYNSKYGPTACGEAIPARISPLNQQIGEELAVRMYRAAGCKGLARIDFFFDTDGYFWMNEINPFPGFTPTSAYPAMWEASGMPMRRLCDEMVICAFHRHRRLSEIRGK